SFRFVGSRTTLCASAKSAAHGHGSHGEPKNSFPSFGFIKTRTAPPCCLYLDEEAIDFRVKAFIPLSCVQPQRVRSVFLHIIWNVEDANILIGFSRFTYVAVHDTARYKSGMPKIGFLIDHCRGDCDVIEKIRFHRPYSM